MYMYMFVCLQPPIDLTTCTHNVYSCTYSCTCTYVCVPQFRVQTGHYCVLLIRRKYIDLFPIANLYAKQWRKPTKRGEELPPKVFQITPNSPTFGEYYDGVQDLLCLMAGMDELLQG